MVVDRGGVMQMLGNRGGSGSSAGGGNFDYNQDKPAGNSGGGNKPKPVSDDEPFDDDIPF